MSYQDDLNTIRDQKVALDHHKTLFAYTRTNVRKAIAEMRASTGPLAKVLSERADECERSLEALMTYHES